MDAFRNAKGLFGLPTAVMTRSKKSPADWWDSYGDECPELKRFAIRVLSLTCSSSDCERNWSAFEMVHTKKRNRLHQEKLNDLIFVMYNLKLKQRQQRKRDDKTQNFDFNEIPSDDEWITEQEDPEMLDVLNRVLYDGEQSHETTFRGDNLGSLESSKFVGSNENQNQTLGDIGNDDFDEEHDHVIDSGNDFGSDQYEGNYGYDD